MPATAPDAPVTSPGMSALRLSVFGSCTRRLSRLGVSTLAISTFSLAAIAAPAAAAADELKPFEASYDWIWHGLTVAESRVWLERKGDDGTDVWIYRSRSEPRGIGRMMAERPVQQSVLRLTGSGVQPLSYHADDGTPSTKRDADIVYNWGQGRVTGTYEDKKVDMPIAPGIQDDLSVQIALMVALLRGHTPGRFSLIDGNSAREYRYEHESEQPLKTAIGDIATMVYRSQKQGSPRITRFWCAPSLGYVPVRVEQKRQDELEWTMEIRSVERH